MAALEEAKVNVVVAGDIPPTQVQFPGQAVKRTSIQAWVGILIVFVGALPEIINIVDSEAGALLPPQFRLWLLGLSAVSVALSAIVSKVMALEKVNALLQKVSLAATPKNGRHEATATITMSPVAATDPPTDGMG